MPFETATARVKQRVRSWPRTAVITIAILLALLIAGRLAMPYVVKRQVNERLAAIPGYWGHVEDIGISLYRGAYNLQDVAIFKVNGATREPFFAAKRIDFSLAWRELFHRKIVSDIVIDHPDVNFVAAGSPLASQKDVDRRWQAVIKDLFPIDITYLEVRDGKIRYQDLTKQPNIDVFAKNLHVLATGLRNRPEEKGEEFPAQINVEGDSLGGGRVKLYIAAEPLAAQPHFHLSAKVSHVNLPDLNDSLRGIAKVDVGRGTFEMAAEMAGKDGGFQGYVKPFFENLDFRNIEDKEKPVFSRVWEHVVAGLAWLVKNKPRDQVGTRIPFQGRFGDAKYGLWTTVANLFRHGFIRAFNPTIEGTIHADNVLPSGDSADKSKVSAQKQDSPESVSNAAIHEDARGAGAPTGRETKEKKK